MSILFQHTCDAGINNLWFLSGTDIADDLSKVGDAVAEAVAMRRPVLVEVPNTFRHPGYGSFGSYDETKS